MSDPGLTPLEKLEDQFDELVGHYGEGADPELRLAAKMLMVALDRFRRHGGPLWASLVREYVDIAIRDPEKFERMLRANRSDKSDVD